jgi:hypothetical protein
MESSKLAIKFFAGGELRPAPKAFIPVFHSWIQTHAIERHMLIDVADYEHVSSGPGVALIAHEGNFSADMDGGLGLLYVRKTPLEGDFEQRVRQTLRIALQACRLLEQEPRLKGVQFRTDGPVFQINDRLLAPNTPQTLEDVRAGLEKVLGEIYGGPVQLRQNPDRENLFEVLVTTPTGLSVETLLERLKKD